VSWSVVIIHSVPPVQQPPGSESLMDAVGDSFAAELDVRGQASKEKQASSRFQDSAKQYATFDQRS